MPVTRTLTPGSASSNNVILKCALDDTKLNFAHVNLGTFRKHKSELEIIFNDTPLNILAVSETWLNCSIPDELINLSGFSVFRNDRARKDKKTGGGVAIFVKKGLRAKIIAKSRKNSVTEFLFIEVQNNEQHKISFGVVYNPPTKNKFEMLEKTLTTLSQTYSDITVLGDFNLNPNNLDPSSTSLKSIFISNGLTLINSEPTNFSNPLNPKLIDLLWSRNPSGILRFSQLSLGSLSTHDLIFGTLDYHPSSCPDIIFKTFRDFNSPTSESLEKVASTLDWDALYSLSNVDEQTRHLCQLLQAVIERAVPLRTIRVDAGRNQPINSELEKLINMREFHHACTRHEKDPHIKALYHAAYKKLRNKTTALKNKLQRRHLRKSLSPDLPAKVLWRNLKQKGVIMQNSSDTERFTASEFNSYFASVFKTSPNLPMNLHDREGDLEFKTVSNEEIFFAINGIGTNAQGLDGIPASLLKKLATFITPHLTYVVNNCITQSYFPVLWKAALVRPIGKVKNPTEMDEFRQISILSALSKILERVLENQIRAHVEEKKLISQCQSGFRPKHSTTSALLKVIDDITEGWERGDCTVLALLDFKKAFDLVPHRKLVQKLNDKFSFSRHACNLIFSYLSDRTQRVKINDEISPEVRVTSGTPQGGILSGLLFSLFIDDITEVVDISIHLYADDTQIYFSAPMKNIDSIDTRMNANLAAISDWAYRNDVAINPSKTQAMIFARKALQTQPPQLRLGNDLIEYTNVAKNLGLHLSNDLSWRRHVNIQCGKVYATLTTLRLSQKFLSTPMKEHLVKTLLVPKLLYCSNIFLGMSTADWNSMKVCFNACIRFVFNLTPRTHISPYVNEVLGCSLKQLAELRACTFLRQLIALKTPEYIFSKIIVPRFQRNGMLKLPLSYNSKERKNSFFVLAPRLWNDLDPHLRRCETLSTFKQEYLASLIEK